MGKEDIDKTVEEVAGITKIGELLERYPSQLSGGQQQRVAVARAMAVHPQIFLMDEPLSNLDAKLRGSMRTELKAIHRATGATSVFVTHDQSEAMSMADRIVIMKDGEIIQIGSPDDVYHHSNCLFVADFIGTPPTNFFPTTISSKNGGKMVSNPHFEVELDDENSATLSDYNKKNLVIGVRPERLSIVSEDEAILSAECLVSEPQGSHQIVAFQLDTEIFKILAPAHPTIQSGENVHLSFEQDAIRFYDPETTLRI